MNTPFDEPVYSKSNAGVEKLNARNIEAELPSYVDWLDSGKQGGTFLQRLLVRILRAQLLSSAQARWSVAWIAPWICLSAELTGLIINTMRRSILGTAARWKTQIKESIIFGGEEIKIPRHSKFAALVVLLYSILMFFYSRFRHGWKSTVCPGHGSASHSWAPTRSTNRKQYHRMVAAFYAKYSHIYPPRSRASIPHRMGIFNRELQAPKRRGRWPLPLNGRSV